MSRLIKYLVSSSIVSVALIVADIVVQPASLMVWYQPEVPKQLLDK